MTCWPLDDLAEESFIQQTCKLHISTIHLNGEYMVQINWLRKIVLTLNSVTTDQQKRSIQHQIESNIVEHMLDYWTTAGWAKAQKSIFAQMSSQHSAIFEAYLQNSTKINNRKNPAADRFVNIVSQCYLSQLYSLESIIWIWFVLLKWAI